jgi:protein DGCR14
MSHVDKSVDVVGKNNNDNIVSIPRSSIEGVIKKPKKVILDEETFVSNIEKIIERDFFPELEKFKIQQAYQEALKTNDFTQVRDLYSKYNSTRYDSSRSSSSSSYNQTPSLFDTTTPSLNSKQKRKSKEEEPYANEEPPVKVKLSLDQFLSKNTSEDNISFEEIMEEAEKKNRLKSHQQWLHEKEKKYALVKLLIKSN